FSDCCAVADTCGAALVSGRNGARVVDVVDLTCLRKRGHGVVGDVPQHIWAVVRARSRGSDGEVTADAGDHAVLSAVEHGKLTVLTVGVPDHGNGSAVVAFGTAADSSGIVDAQRLSLAVR